MRETRRGPSHCHFLKAFRNHPWGEQLRGGRQDSGPTSGFSGWEGSTLLCLSWLEDITIEDSRLFQGAFLDARSQLPRVALALPQLKISDRERARMPASLRPNQKQVLSEAGAILTQVRQASREHRRHCSLVTLLL